MPAETNTSSGKGGHALVVGGGMAGLLAARVLSGHFGQVTLIERDCFPEGPEPRKGIPQSRHLHTFLKSRVTPAKLCGSTGMEDVR